ncbi:hypothetical protein ISN45_Aa07g039230 [Arabidopsis thaliana x Arabidopsis arenosa]|uniref:DUF7950 domain-containing protein n=1 Tax=Arabidopsis thaliana x Arabidopsis arenosa TaxID=1240361 RepID=A0A8T1YDM5_9BRAS|nr:hypothetical protein ISN45_Aa07g039230 [Arabidopsis thaliana x Arabidopsis arenosa]
MNDNGKQRQASVCDGATDQDKTVISKIMQRFRPIAPKPAVGESSDDTKSCRFLGRNRRSKRKYVRVRDKKTSSVSNNKNKIIGKKNGCDRGNIKTTDLDKEIDGDDRSDIVTLEFLPEKGRDLGNNGNQAGEFCSDLSDMNPKKSLYGSIIGLSSSLDRTVMESWLTVECVSDTCTDLGEYHILEQLGRMDQGQERVMRMLEVDTCPWLVSDGSNRVCWVNQAYRRMIGAPDVEVIRVWLVVAMDLMEEIACMVELYGAVTCRVRVRYEPSTWRMMTVPCDVWRIRSDGFAWRLDVESALRLGM